MVLLIVATGNTGTPATTAGADEFVGHLAGVRGRGWCLRRRRARARGAQRAEHVGGLGQQATDAAHERPDRGDVGAADEPHRATGRLAERERGVDAAEREAAAVAHQQRAGAGRQVVRAADA